MDVRISQKALDEYLKKIENGAYLRLELLNDRGLFTFVLEKRKPAPDDIKIPLILEETGEEIPGVELPITPAAHAKLGPVQIEVCGACILGGNRFDVLPREF